MVDKYINFDNIEIGILNHQPCTIIIPFDCFISKKYTYLLISSKKLNIN